VVWHGLLNALVTARAVGVAGFEETTTMWLVQVLGGLPLLAYGAVLLRKLRAPSAALAAR
jgi:hypothetical protein